MCFSLFLLVECKFYVVQYGQQLLTATPRGIVTAIIRFLVFYGTALGSDPTYLGSKVMIITVVEPGAYFICCCLPYIRPLAYLAYQKTCLPRIIMRATNAGSKPSQPSFLAKPGKSIKVTHSLSASISDDDRVGFIELMERGDMNESGL